MVGLVLVGFLVGTWACGAVRGDPPTPMPVTGTPRDDLPDDFQVGPLAAFAFLGEDLVVAEQHSEDGTRVVAVTPAGEVTELPGAPRMLARTLVADGDSVVLIGGHCPGDGCRAPLEAHRLRADRSGWDRLGTPDLGIFEAGIETRGGSAERPLVWTSAGMITVEDDQVVELGSSGDGAVPPTSASTCATTSDAADPVAYNVWTRAPLSRRSLDPGDRWHRVDAVGAPAPIDEQWSVVCTGDSVLALHHLVEHRFDGTAWTVDTGPPVGPDRLLSWASTPDGTLYASTANGGRVLRRAADGGWSDTDHSADHVAVSPSGRLWLLPDHGGTIEVLDAS